MDGFGAGGDDNDDGDDGTIHLIHCLISHSLQVCHVFVGVEY